MDFTFLFERLLNKSKPKVFDDFADKINSHTVTILLLFAIAASGKQYFGTPIQCWSPSEFKSGWEQYAEDLCFIQGTYFVPENSSIPGGSKDSPKEMINYYQYVPTVLGIQAVMFLLPSLILLSLYKQCGLDFEFVISKAEDLKTADTETRNKEISSLVKLIEDILETRSSTISGHFQLNLASFLYIVVKLWTLVNIALQFHAVNSFLGTNSYFWGWSIFTNILTGRGWEESGIFPRITRCEFVIPMLDNFTRYTVQCVLMINMFNEMIYTFLWFWFVFVLVQTVINSMFTVFRFILSCCRRKFIRKLLKKNFGDEASRRPIKDFVNNWLEQDGFLLMRLLNDHAGEMVTRSICEQLFQNYQNRIAEGNQQGGTGAAQ